MAQENDKNGIDLSKMLEETPKSSGGQWPSGPYVSPTAPKIIRWLIKYSGGLIKNENQAAYVLLGIIALAIIVSLFLIFGGGGGQITPPPEEYIDKPQFLPE